MNSATKTCFRATGNAAQFGHFPVAGLIYVVGGMGELGGELHTLESYNPVTHEWHRLARMSTRRAYVGVTALDGFIYAVGGWNETQRALKTVERYSVEEVGPDHRFLPSA